MSGRALALPWFTSRDYGTTRDGMADRDRLPEGYEQWLLSARQIEEELKRVGYEVTRVVIDRDSFAAWCEERGAGLDGRARSAYAAEMAGLDHRTGG